MSIAPPLPTRVSTSNRLAAAVIDETAAIRMRRIIGPPGCGKTTRLARLCQEAALQYGSEAVMVMSLTRAAAATVANKQIDGHRIPVAKHNIGTMHSFAYRGLGRPEIADTPKNLATWNEWIVAQGMPTYRISVEGADIDDAVTEAQVAMSTRGDEAYSEYGIARARIQGTAGLSASTQGFVAYWEQFKREHDMLDFSEMLERAYLDLECAPGDPKVILGDEWQDTNMLGMRLVRSWGERAEDFYVVGDPLQNLYEWAGTSPEAFTYPRLPGDQQEVLGQSYRVPRQVRDFAFAWIEPHRREVERQLGTEIQYRPRIDPETKQPVEGKVRPMLDATWKFPEPAIADAIKQMDAGREVMFIAACSYMLSPLISALRSRGIPYHNPFRLARYDWNPLTPAKGTSASTRLLSFLRLDERIWGDDVRLWNSKELWQWVEILEAKGLLKRGAKEQIKEAAERPVQYTEDGSPMSGELSLADFAGWFEDVNAIVNLAELQANGRALDWIRGRILGTRKKSLDFPISIADRYGPQKLREKPKVVIGTIHCSPGDELVLTTSGYVPIGELDPTVHRLASYNWTCNRMTWGVRAGNTRKGAGFGFSVASNPYSGRLITITTEKSQTRVTPDHRIRARFTNSFYGKWVVYLMRRGNWWRVGMCKSANKPYKCGDLHSRLGTEKADCGWILGVYETRKEAIAEEVRIQGHYGIPSLTFHAENNRVLSSLELGVVHELTSAKVIPRVHELISERGWMEDVPMYKRGVGRGVNGSTSKACGGGHNRAYFQTGYAFETIAANLIPGYMEIPVAGEEFHVTQWRAERGFSTPDWLPISVSSEHYDGEVFSLQVDPYEFYVSGGAVVHNSLKGTEAPVVYLFPDISNAAMQQWMTPGPGREGIRRAFYVAMTRAMETLVICQRATPHAIVWPALPK